MTTLIRTEWLKMRKYNAFWWVMGLTALSYPGINFIFYQVYSNITTQPNSASRLAKMAIGNPYTFPDVWHTVAYFSSWFVFIPAVVVIMFITNEYSFRTHRQNIIDGWSRNQFITSKLIDVLLITLMITALYAGVCFITGMISQERLIHDTWSQFYYTGLFAMQTFAQLTLAFLTGFLIRKAFMALAVFLFWFIILENILVMYLKFNANDIGRFFPFEISDRLVPVPAFLGKLDQAGYDKAVHEIPLYTVYTIILTFGVWALCYWMNRRRDLK